MAKPEITYGELQKQLIDEAKVLLDIAKLIAGKNPNALVPPQEILSFEAMYRANPPETMETAKAAGTGRARITC